MAGEAGELKEAEAFAFPIDSRDGWEPGVPSVRVLGRSAIGGALAPLAVYYLIRHQVGSDAAALAIAGVPAAVWVIINWLRHQTVDPIGLLTLMGFALGLSTSFALGGDAFVLKVRDSAITCTFGLVCLASLWISRRPMMFFLGRAMSAGDDPVRRRLYDQLWELPAGRTAFRILTAVWGVGLVAEAAMKVTLAMVLPTGPFLAVSPVLAGVVIGSLFMFTVWFSRRSRMRAEQVGANA